MIYLGTSVAPLSPLGQSGADEVARLTMNARATERLVSSCLLTVEMARAAYREHFDILVVGEFIEGAEFAEIGPDVIERVNALAGELKSFDAIHPATAALLDNFHRPVTVLIHDTCLTGATRF